MGLEVITTTDWIVLDDFDEQFDFCYSDRLIRIIEKHR